MPNNRVTTLIPPTDFSTVGWVNGNSYILLPDKTARQASITNLYNPAAIGCSTGYGIWEVAPDATTLLVQYHTVGGTFTGGTFVSVSLIIPATANMISAASGGINPAGITVTGNGDHQILKFNLNTGAASVLGSQGVNPAFANRFLTLAFFASNFGAGSTISFSAEMY